MQTVTDEFLTAIEATEREIRAKVEIVFLDNSMLGATPTYSASTTLDATNTPSDLAFNGKITPERDYGWIGDDCFPSDDVYPIAGDGSSEVGWWSNGISRVADVIADSSGNGYNAASYTGTTGQTGAITGDTDKCMYFAYNQGVDFGDVAGLNPDSVFSVELWVKFTVTDNNYHGFMGWQNGAATNRSPCMYQFDQTKLHGGFSSTDDTWCAWNTAAGAIVADGVTWHHIVYTFDGTYHRVYVNNSLVVEDNTHSGKVPKAVPLRYIGNGLDNNNQVYIDEVAYYNTVLSPARIDAHYAARTEIYYTDTVIEDSPVAYWRLGVVTSGEFCAPETISIDYNANQTIQTVKVYGDSRLGYPVDFRVDYSAVASPTASDWTNITIVTGNALTEWSYSLPVTIAATHLRLKISKWSAASKRAKIIEFEGGYSVDVSSDIVSFSITKERNATDDSNTLPYGNSSANEFEMIIDNTTGDYYLRNTSSPYYGYLKQNRKIRTWLGVTLPDDSIEYLPQGTYYTKGWKASRTSPEASVSAGDKAKLMLEKDFSESIVYEGKTLSELAVILANAFDLVPGEYSIDGTTETMPYAYFTKDKYWNHFNKLAEGETGAVYYNETNVLIFENRYHLFSTRLSEAATAGDDHIHTDAVYGLVVGDTIYVDDNTNNETVVIDSSWNGSSTTVPITTTLTNSYPLDSYVYKNAVVATLSDTSILTDDEDLYDLDKAKNKIEVKAKPLIVPLDGLSQPVITTIWQLDEILTVPASSYEDVDVFFQSAPVIKNDTYTVDITITTDIEGDEANITASWQPSTPYAWGGHLRLTNSESYDIDVVGCLIEGVVLQEYGGIIETVENTVLQSEQGERPYSVESSYIQRKDHALSIANNLLAIWQDPMAPQSCKGRGLPHLQLGDRVKLIDTELGITNANVNNHFFITRIVLDYDGGLEATYDLLAA